MPLRRRRLPVLLSALLTAAAPAPDAPAPSTTAGPPSIAAFAQLPFMDSPQLSPDGTKVAARVAVHGEQRLAIIPIAAAGKPVVLGLGELQLNSWSWVNDDWLITRVGQMKAVVDDRWYLRRAVAVKADGTKMNMLARDFAGQNADDVLWIAHDGSPHILLAAQTSIYGSEPGFWPQVSDYDVSTGRSRVVVGSTSNVFDWYADTAGAVRLGVSYDDASRAYRLLYRDGKTGGFRTVEKARGHGAQLGEMPALFLADGKGIAFDDDDGFNALYDFDFKTFHKGKKVFGTPGYDLDSVVADDLGTRIMGVRYTDTRGRTQWFDPALAKVQADIDKAVGARQAQITSWNRDFSVFVVFVGGADRPGGYYIYRLSDGAMHLLAKVNDTLGNAAYSPVKSIRYKARDGLEIEAVLTLPRDRAPTKLPLILMPHGGPSARDDESWDWWAQFLASRGYAVLQPNYRGSTGYGTAFLDKGKGQWGLAMQDDLTDAVHWAAKEGIADPARVCIVGGSYGGYAALRAAQRDAGVYRCAVSFAGVSDMPAMMRYDGQFLNGGRSKDWIKEQTPDLKAVSPLNYARDFSIPVLLMHGKLDTVVPVSQSRQMAERLKAAGKPYRYVEQPKGDHHFTNEADRVQFLTEVEAFLKQYDPA